MQAEKIKAIKTILANDPSVVFSYLFGSSTDSDSYNDIDIAVYATDESSHLQLSADLKIALSEKTGQPPDRFDVRVINHLLMKGDLFALLFLRDILSRGELLVDNDFQQRTAFIEAFGMKYRECEGLIAEVLA